VVKNDIKSYPTPRRSLKLSSLTDPLNCEVRFLKKTSVGKFKLWSSLFFKYSPFIMSYFGNFYISFSTFVYGYLLGLSLRKSGQSLFARSIPAGLSFLFLSICYTVFGGASPIRISSTTPFSSLFIYWKRIYMASLPHPFSVFMFFKN